MVSNIDPNSIIQCAEKFGLCLDGSIEDTMDAIVRLEIERDVRGLSPMEIMFLRNSRMHSKDSIQHGQSFKPRHDDVFITTYPKCGTTWVSQICHCLRSNGDMNFEEIGTVVPWDILALDCNQNLEDEQVATPRLFKSHEDWAHVPGGGAKKDAKRGDHEAKYIYVVRNPKDAFVSFFNFLPAYAGLESGSITMKEFADAIFAGVSQAGGIWRHFLSFWHVRERPNVLILFFEDLKEDLRANVKLIANFMGIQSEKSVDMAVEKSMYSFMRAHATQFDDHFVFDCVKKRMGLGPKHVFKVGKVRKGGGKVGERKKIPDEVQKMLDMRWSEVLSETTGCENYAAFRKSLSKIINKNCD
eukprot:g2620.t1